MKNLSLFLTGTRWKLYTHTRLYVILHTLLYTTERTKSLKIILNSVTIPFEFVYCTLASLKGSYYEKNYEIFK